MGGATRLGLRLALLLLAPLVARAPAAASSGPPAVAFQEGTAATPAAAPLEEALEATAEPPKEELAAELELFERRLRFAGRPWVPGLPALRDREREQSTRLAVESLAVELGRRPIWGERWHAILARGAAERDGLWAAAARCVGRLGHYEHAPVLVSVLAEPLGDGRDLSGHGGGARQAALEGLHDLYGRWLAGVSEASPFLERVRAGDGTRLLVGELLAAEQVLRRSLGDALRASPSQAVARLQDPDPGVRRVAAQVLAEAVGEGRLERGPLAEPLLEQLRREAEPRAFHALQSALVSVLEQEPADAEPVRALRQLLFNRDDADCALSIARALSRLPWDPSDAASDAHPLRAVARAGELLALQVAEGRRQGFHDPDPLVETLLALQVLCERAAGAGLADELRAGAAREPVFEMVRDREQNEVVRVAAAETLGAFALPTDWPFLVAAFSDDDAPPTLSHALLGSLRQLLPVFLPGMPGSEELLTQVVALTGAEDPDLRRRALTLFGTEELQPLMASVDASFLVERFEAEEVPDLAQRVIALLRRFGRPDVLVACLGTERFDELAGDPRRLGELVGLCRDFAGARPRETLRAADRLAGVEGEATRIARLRHAVALVAGLDERSVELLSPEAHGLIASWAWNLHLAGVAFDDSMPPSTGASADSPVVEPLVFVRRLVRTHIPRANRMQDPAPEAGAEANGDPGETAYPGDAGHLANVDPSFDATAHQHLLAVCMVYLVRSDPEPPALEEVEAAFEAALAGADGNPRPGLAALVRRDRARFRADTVGGMQALQDYRELAAGSVLEIPDLRRTIQLVAEMGGATPAAKRVVAPEAFDFTLALLRRPSWRVEPTGVRLRDTQELVEWALSADDPELLLVTARLLAELPAAGADAPEEDLWGALARDPESRTTLEQLAERSRAALATHGESWTVRLDGEEPSAPGGEADAGAPGEAEESTDAEGEPAESTGAGPRDETDGAR